MSIREKAIGALKRASTRTFEHFKGRIQEINKVRREKERKIDIENELKKQEIQSDTYNLPREKDPNYITVPPSRRQDVMSVGRRIIK